jgi:hypothetical protein
MSVKVLESRDGKEAVLYDATLWAFGPIIRSEYGMTALETATAFVKWMDDGHIPWSNDNNLADHFMDWLDSLEGKNARI